MAQVPRVDDFPSIHDLDLSSRRVRCIYFLPNKARQCSQTQALDPVAVRKAKEKLVIACFAGRPTAEDLSPLAELPELLCCWQHKPKVQQQTHIGKELRRRWQNELRGSSSESPAIGREVHATASASERTASVRPNTQRIPPRYNLRSNPSTSSSTSTSTSHHISSGALTEFEPMTKSRQTLANLLLRGPTEAQQKNISDLYAFSRASSPGMLKIGFSVNDSDRLRAWERNCRYQPILKHHLSDVPFGSFVESLIHFELLPYWRREIQCKHNPNCARRHQEWFEIDEATAFNSMDNWVDWIVVGGPYKANGVLRRRWRLSIEEMVEQGLPVTSQSLMDLLETPSERDNLNDVPVANTPGVTSTNNNAISVRPAVERPVIAEANIEATAGAADIVSALAAAIVSLSTAQRQQIRDLLDRTAPISAPRPSRLLPSVLVA